MDFLNGLGAATGVIALVVTLWQWRTQHAATMVADRARLAREVKAGVGAAVNEVLLYEATYGSYTSHPPSAAESAREARLKDAALKWDRLAETLDEQIACRHDMPVGDRKQWTALWTAVTGLLRGTGRTNNPARDEGLVAARTALSEALGKAVTTEPVGVLAALALECVDGWAASLERKSRASA